MQNQKMQMYEIINDPDVLHKYETIDIFTKYFGTYKLLKHSGGQLLTIKGKSDFLNKRLVIRLEDRIKLIREKQYQLRYKLKSSMRVDLNKSKEILKDLIQITLSEPRSELLMEMRDTITILVNGYLQNPNIVSYLTKICVHDYSTQQHLINVMLYCMGYAYSNGFTKEDIEVYGLIGLMHDIGKVSIPDYVLQARRKLTPKEWEKIKDHPASGWRILRACDFDVRVRVAAQEHHERLDGSGYPDGKTGQDLYEASKVLSIIDMFEALTTWRPYKDPIKPFTALQVIKQQVMKQKLDSELFKNFAYSIVGMTSN